MARKSTAAAKPPADPASRRFDPDARYRVVLAAAVPIGGLTIRAGQPATVSGAALERIDADDIVSAEPV